MKTTINLFNFKRHLDNIEKLTKEEKESFYEFGNILLEDGTEYEIEHEWWLLVFDMGVEDTMQYYKKTTEKFIKLYSKYDIRSVNMRIELLRRWIYQNRAHVIKER